MTYNVHRCVGTDGKLSPQRIAEVIAMCDPHVVALQELDVGRIRTGVVDQAAVIAKALGMQSHFHPAMRILGEQYGDAILTSSPSTLVRAGLLPSPNGLRREPRGALRVATEIDGMPLDIINTHLGLTRAERGMQVGALLGPDWIGEPGQDRALILTGDFNVGPRSRTHRRLATRLQPALSPAGKRLRTFPSRLPVLSLDHFFTSDAIRTIDVRTVRTKLTGIASDHLPLIAEFHIVQQSSVRERAA